MGPGPPGRQHHWKLLLYEKMLKETENEETKLFCHIFSLVAFRLGEDPRPLGPPTGYADNGNFNAICDIKILCALLLVCPCVYVNVTLMILFCMIMLNM